MRSEDDEPDQCPAKSRPLHRSKLNCNTAQVAPLLSRTLLSAARSDSHAEIRDRTRTTRRRQALGGAAPRDLSKVVRCFERDGTLDPVARKLRDGRQDLLRLHRSQRANGPAARGTRRIPGESDFGSAEHDQSVDRGTAARVGTQTFASRVITFASRVMTFASRVMTFASRGKTFDP